MEQGAHTTRIFTLGALAVEQRANDGTWREVPNAAWGKTTHARNVLGFLLCHQRIAHRERIIEALWPKEELVSQDSYIYKAISRLRHLLSPESTPSLLRTTRGIYQLADQSQIWVDADHCDILLAEIKGLDVASPERLPLLQEVIHHLTRGTFFEEEKELWYVGRRHIFNTADYCCRLWLAKEYEICGVFNQAEKQLTHLLRKNPMDDQVLCSLMLLLHKQGMTAEALHYYRETTFICHQYDHVLSKGVHVLATRLNQQMSCSFSKESSFSFPTFSSERIDMQTGYYHSTIGSTRTSQFAPTDPLTDSPILEHFSRVLAKPLDVDDSLLSYLAHLTSQYWQNKRNDILPCHVLLTYAHEHLKIIMCFLDRSLFPSQRLFLCGLASDTTILVGSFYFELKRNDTARSYYHTAIQAAKEARQPQMEAIGWGWMSFTWTYNKKYAQALSCIQKARALSMHTDIETFAWLAAIEAEIRAHLGEKQACFSALGDAESIYNLTQDRKYVSNFDSLRLSGYQGICFKLLFNPGDPSTRKMLIQAQESLSNALQLVPPTQIRRRCRMTIDLAGVSAKQGDLDAVQVYTTQAMLLTAQAKSQICIQRLMQLRNDLEPWKETSLGKTLEEALEHFYSSL